MIELFYISVLLIGLVEFNRRTSLKQGELFAVLIGLIVLSFVISSMLKRSVK